MTKKSTTPDHVEFGSDAHAALLGLKKAGKDDVPEHEGWALMDVTAFGPAARPEYLREVLRQKVSTLLAGRPPAPQSDDPLAPNYAPPIWRPSDVPVSGEV